MSDTLNLDKLIKMLKLTATSNDNEALVAIRMANTLLGRFGGDWEALLKGKVTIIEDPFNSMPAPRAQERQRPRPNPPSRPQAPPPPQAAYSPPQQRRKRPTSAPKSKPAPTPMPQQTFAKSPLGEWCVCSPVALRPGQTVDVLTRAQGIRHVEIVALYTSNHNGDFLYSFKNPIAPDLSGLS